MSELIIRKATAQDLDSIADLEQVCFSVPWSKESLKRDLIDNKMSTYIVAELEGMIVGYVGLWAVIEEGHINNVAVSPLYRRQHIATILIDTMISGSGAAGIKSHTLEVRAGNIAARKLYENFGFKEAGVRKNYYEDNNEDAIIMWRQ